MSRERGGIGSGSEIEKRINKRIKRVDIIFEALMTPPIMIYRQPGISELVYRNHVHDKAGQIADALKEKKL